MQGVHHKGRCRASLHSIAVLGQVCAIFEVLGPCFRPFLPKCLSSPFLRPVIRPFIAATEQGGARGRESPPWRVGAHVYERPKARRNFEIALARLSGEQERKKLRRLRIRKLCRGKKCKEAFLAKK